MEKGSISLLKMERLKVPGKMERLMDLEFVLIKMEINCQVFINRIKDMDKE